MVHFTDPFWLWLLLSIPLIYWIARLRRKPLRFSNTRIHSNLKTFSWIGFIEASCIYLGFATLAIAMAQPNIYKLVEQPSIDTRDFIMLIDTSDSMEWGMVDPSIADGLAKDSKPSILTGSRPKNIVKRITAAQVAIESFLDMRDGDRVGFIIFDMNAYFGWPFTNDLSVITKRISGLPTYVGAGTEFDGKRSPLNAAIRHFDEIGQAKTKAILMVTDGEGEIADDRINAIAKDLNDREIKLYVVGIGYKAWSEVPDTQDLRNLVGKVKGKIVEVGDVREMQLAFSEINQLETSLVKMESKLEKHNISHWFMLLGLLALAGFGLITCLVTDEI